MSNTKWFGSKYCKKCDLIGREFCECERKHGGKRPNQVGRPPLPEHEKRVKVSTFLAAGSKEKAESIAKKLDLPGWGHAVDLAIDVLTKLVEENEITR